MFITQHRIDVHLHLEGVPLLAKLLNDFLNKGAKIMASLDDLEQAVKEQTTVASSVTTLLTTIEQKLKDATSGKLDPATQARVDNIFNELKGNTQQLSDAITANTPADDGTDNNGGQVVNG